MNSYYHYLIEYLHPVWRDWCEYEGTRVYLTRTSARSAKKRIIQGIKRGEAFNDLTLIVDTSKIKLRIIKRTIENKIIR